ncbi:hypothetical protein [Oryza sativa Japonica Group]|uniref:Uncharacterized protein n=1 Tax=Oryza sativa subsp. japonica TaxID=39947 RepID=Q5JMV2_ORYSJ|nr:hypothetical protein [Oryza sativa Japonica Group]
MTILFSAISIGAACRTTADRRLSWCANVHSTPCYLVLRCKWIQTRIESDLRKHMDVFDQLVKDLNYLDVKLDDKDKVIILLSSLPTPHEHVVTTMTYGKVKHDNDTGTSKGKEKRVMRPRLKTTGAGRESPNRRRPWSSCETSY